MHNRTQKQVKEANCQLGKRAGLHPQIRAVQHKGATKLKKVSVWETKRNVFLVRRIIQYIIKKKFKWLMTVDDKVECETKLGPVHCCNKTESPVTPILPDYWV